MIKLRIMALLDRNCGNCKWRKGDYCRVPVKYFDAFKGLVTQPEDFTFCTSVVGRTNCKWRKTDD